MMRLFIGTSIDETTADRIRSAAKEFLGDDRWRMAPIEQWHVTALFIGERDPQALPMIEKEMISIAQRTVPITLINGRIASMPEQDPHMLWVKFEPDRQLTDLHLALAEATSTRPSKHIPITPHITLARSRRSPPSATSGVILEPLRLDHLSLFRSELRRSGAVHQLLHTVPLLE